MPTIGARATVGLSQETWFADVRADDRTRPVVVRLPTPSSGHRAIVTQRRALDVHEGTLRQSVVLSRQAEFVFHSAAKQLMLATLFVALVIAFLAAMIVLPTATLAVNERPAIRVGAAVQAIDAVPLHARLQVPGPAEVARGPPLPGEDPSRLDTPEQVAEEILLLCQPSFRDTGKLYDYPSKRLLAFGRPS